ncbi:hypothetical protein [Lyngbya confervoides]|uniref:Uncharacterized protein n=1 Tax=Lyngbya confervoides BDU141951 TaxID=1574623 RepID=A0ABD4T143_9CYAN|nr:hypothetical protein [Lyngbya confervoides]MCM1982153.1 hypothetical protein [Lyngbya confervoides BDU141951]
MEKRQSVLDQFSSFIQWRNDQQFGGWQTHPRLRRRMVQFLDRDPSLTQDRYWVL